MADDDASCLDDWHQGDLALVPIDLPFVILDESELAVAFMDAPHGVAVLTQSCEIIKPAAERPTVQVAVLVPVDDDDYVRIEGNNAPTRVIVPGLGGMNLAIDLDSVATVAKDVLISWPRTEGCPSDQDQRVLASKLARHRQRFAFPDAFNDLIQPLRRLVQKKRKAQSHIGNFIREIDEFRVVCNDWSNPTELTILVIVKREATEAEGPSWDAAIKGMAAKALHDDFPEPEWRVVTMEDISAAEYQNSDRLDWDGLSDV